MKYYSFIIWYKVPAAMIFHDPWENKEYINKTLYITKEKAEEAAEIMRNKIAKDEDIIPENMGIQIIKMHTNEN